MEYLGIDKLINKTVPIVSVSIPTYNHEKYIGKCIEGALMQQTNFPYEIIIGEDDSSDQTREICKAYAEKHPDKIRLFLRSREDVIYIGGKPSGRFNFTENIKTARGKYVALCEGDDYWTDPLKLQKQVDVLETNPNYAICFHKVTIEQDGVLIEDSLNINTQEVTTAKRLLQGNYIHTPSSMFRKHDTLLPFPKWYYEVPVGDWPLSLLCAIHGDIKYLDEPMAVYRKHAAGIWSVSKSKVQKDISVVKVREGLLEYFRAKNIKELESISVNILFNRYFKLATSEHLPVDEKAIYKNKILRLIKDNSISTRNKIIGATLFRYTPFWKYF